MDPFSLRADTKDGYSTFGIAPMVAFAYTVGGGIVVALGMLAMLRSVARSARDDPTSPRIVASVPSDVEAAIIIDVLGDNGIRARAVGRHTAGFLGQSLGDVHIVVAQADAERAFEILAETDLEGDDHVRT